jgi:SAM-dependent methyltransferase
MTTGMAPGYLREMAASGYRLDAVGPFHRVMVPWLAGWLGVPRDGVVIDLGAGQGHCLLPLHEAGWRNLVAVDVDDVNFAAFRATLGCRTVRADLAHEPLPLGDRTADAVVCFHVIEHLDDPTVLVREVRRILRPGAPLALVTPDWRKAHRTFFDDPTHRHPFTKASIARLLRMHGFAPRVWSWNSRFGLGRLQAYRLWPRLGMIGTELLAIARPTQPGRVRT